MVSEDGYTYQAMIHVVAAKEAQAERARARAEAHDQAARHEQQRQLKVRQSTHRPQTMHD